MSNKKEFGKDVLVYGLGNGIKKFIGLFLLPFYTRALTPADYGILDTLSTGIFLITAFLNLGLDSAAGFYFFRTEDEKEKGEILYTKFIIHLFSVIPIIAIIIFAQYISSILFSNEKYTSLIIITALLIPVNLLLNEQSHIFRYYRMPWKYNLITLIKSLSNIGFGISFVVVLKYGVWGAQLASFISSIVVILISFFFFTRKIYSFSFSFLWAKKMVKFGFPLIWAGMLAWIYSSSDRYFLLNYRDLTEIGYYSIASTFTQPIGLLNMAIQMSWGVLFYAVYNKEIEPEKEKTKLLMKDIFTYYIIVSGMIAGFISIFGYEIISTFATVHYLPAIIALPFLTFSSIFGQAFQITSVGITVAQKTWYFTIIILFAAIINFSLNFYFVPAYGYFGAGITTLIAYFIYWYFGYTVSKKYIKVNLPLIKLGVFITSILLASILITTNEIWYNMHLPIWVKIIIFIICAGLPFALKLINPNSVKNNIISIYKKYLGVKP